MRNYQCESTNKKQSNEVSLYLKLMSNENKFKFWIKTLLSSFQTFPEIISTIDKIIELQASTISFSSDIYNKQKKPFDQYEKVIDLSERKNSILNIYIMTKEMLKKLSYQDFEFIEKRFIYNWGIEELAKEYEVSMRTIYRRTDKIIDQIYKNSIANNWSLKFIESQTNNEDWLKERFLKSVSDYIKLCPQSLEKLTAEKS